MKIDEITGNELKYGKSQWNDEEFQKHYQSSHLKGDLDSAADWFRKKPKKEREKTWPTKIWNKLSNSEKTALELHSIDRYGNKQIHKVLEKVISLSDPLLNNIVSYRGINVSKEMVNGLIKQLKSGKYPVLKNKHPSSFTNEQYSAWRFSKRLSLNGVPILLEILIPTGTKIARIALHHGIGNEHVVSANTKYRLVKVSKFRNGYKFSGYLIS